MEQLDLVNEMDPRSDYFLVQTEVVSHKILEIVYPKVTQQRLKDLLLMD